jgi:RNA polymerase sigma-B factor
MTAAAERNNTLERFREYQSVRSRELRNQLVEEHLELAQSLARRFAHRNEPLEDLEQVAVLGLVKAVDGYDPDRGVPFHAFAIPTIVGELRRYFRDRGWMVRVPRRMQELHLRLASLVADLSQRLGRSPTPREVAAEAGVDEEDVLVAMEAGNCYRPASLDSASNRRDSGEVERLGALDEQLEWVEDRSLLHELLHRLTPREQKILYLRFFEEKTQAEIAAEVGMSQMHVSRLLARSLRVLGCTDTDLT